MPTPANETIIDVLQQIADLLNKIVIPAPINPAVDAANIAIDIVQESNGDWKATVSSTTGIVTATIVGVGLEAVTLSAATIAFSMSPVGAALIFYEGSVASFQVALGVQTIVEDELLDALNSYFPSELDSATQDKLDEIDSWPNMDAEIEGLIEEAFLSYQTANTIIAPKDPLVLDLDGDGIHTIAQGDSSAFFDLDGDVFAEQTAWISGADGFLVQDHNANNYVDGIGELFGSDTLPGLDELEALDSNSDGKITSTDTDWATLKVWRDADEDGVTDAGELHSLASLDITELRYDGQHDGRTVNGVQFAGVAGFTIDGNARELAELLFPNSEFDTQYVGGRELAQLIAQNAMVFSQGIGSQEARLLNTI